MQPSPKKGRRPASGTAAAAADAIQQAAAGWPSPPVKLLAVERKFWDAVMIARLPQQWAQVDLTVAVNLARALCEIERQRKAVRSEGDILEGRLNPRHSLIETLNRRVLAQMRLLQLHAVATIGAKGLQPGTKAEAGNAAAVLKKPQASDDADSLLARPRRLQ